MKIVGSKLKYNVVINKTAKGQNRILILAGMTARSLDSWEDQQVTEKKMIKDLCNCNVKRN